MTTPASPAPARLFALSALVPVALALPGVALNRWEVSLGEAQRFVPSLAAVQGACMALPALGLVALVVLLVRAWPSLAALSSGQRAGLVAGVAALQMALVVGAGYANLLTRPNFLFGPPAPFASVASPDGAHTAYAVQACLVGCLVDVYVRDGSGLVMRRVQRHTNSRADQGSVVWPAASEGSIEVRGLRAAPGVGALFGGWN